MPDLMIDIETWGTDRADVVITEIGWASFDLDGSGPIETGVFLVDPQSCLDSGFKVDSKTVKWWMAQDDLARQGQTNRESEQHILSALHEIYNLRNKRFENIWANPAWFDLAILRHCFTKMGLLFPWDRKKIRCGSSLVNFAQYMRDFDPEPFKPAEAAHKGDIDAGRQVVLVQQAWKALQG